MDEMQKKIEAALRQRRLREMEKYNRRCRRITLLALAGRKLTDHIVKYRTDMMKLGFESNMKEITA